MNKNRADKAASHPSQSFLGLAVLVLLGLLTTAGIKSYHELAAARRHEQDLEQRIESTEERISTLSRRIERIENDPFDLERAAREQLGMVRPGDVVIILPDEELDGTEESSATLTHAKARSRIAPSSAPIEEP